MKLLRTVLVLVVLIMGLAAPLAFTSTADAHQGHGQVRYYHVYYRDCCHSPWSYYGAYACPQQAQAAANWFRYYGYEVYVR